jgi:hypothetical protein
MPRSAVPKLFISAIAAGLLILSVLRGIDVNAGVVALAVIAVLPWLAPLIDTMELPGGGSVTFREVKEEIGKQKEQLNAQQEIINQLVIYSMSGYLFNLLSQLYHRARDGGEYRFTNDESMIRDLRYLRDHGYLEHFYIRQLPEGTNLAGQLKLTPVGNYFVEVREALEALHRTRVVEQLS